jgi:hypothetical protein
MTSRQRAYDPPQPHDPADAAVEGDTSASRDAYNIITDTVTGVNVRGTDNKFQAIFTFASALIGAGIGSLLAVLNPRWELAWFGGALAGGFLGMVFGVFTSGIWLMIYRFMRHFRGKHD